MTEKKKDNGVVSTSPHVITDREAEQITRVEELSYELGIDEVMTRNPQVVTPDVSMQELADHLRQSRISGVPVVSNGILVGIISIEDLIRALTQGKMGVPISEYMTTDLISVKAHNPVVEALKLFAQTKVGRLPVVDENDRLVGIITKGDITRGVLNALERDYQTEELRRYRASHLFEDIISDRTTLILRYYITPRDFNRGGQASSHLKRALLRLGASPQIARRCGIAAYEAEMNLIIHATDGGTIRVGVEPTDIMIEAIDEGPGIPDVDLAMTPGYSTATHEVREMGFGAGMGLRNIQRCTDKMTLESTLGKGTRVAMKIYLQEPVHTDQQNSDQGEDTQ